MGDFIISRHIEFSGGEKGENIAKSKYLPKF